MFMRFLRWLLGVALVAGVAAMLYASLIEPRWVRVERVERALPGLPPALDGVRVVFVSDTHFGRFLRDEDIDRLERLLRAERPDLLLIGGDVTEEFAYGRKALEACGRIAAPLGAYGIAGNHEYAMIERALGRVDKARGIAYLRDMYAGTGVELLMDETRRIERDGASLEIVGADHDMATRELASLVESTAPDACRILLAHTPDTLTRWVDAGHDPDAFALSLAGHAHGGQVTAFGLYAPIRVVGPRSVNTGWRAYGSLQHRTSNGFGMTGIPLRFFARPEIHVITLRAGGA